MPVRFKDTAEYHQRFTPLATKTQKNSGKAVSDQQSGHHQPLVSILKTSVLPTERDDKKGSHSDDYVLLGDQSKFAPSIRYRLRPTAVHQTPTPPSSATPTSSVAPPPSSPSFQKHSDTASTSLHVTEDVRVRGQSLSQGRDAFEKTSVLIGHGTNSRRSQGCQSNDVGDRQTAERLVDQEQKEEERVRREGRLLGQTYKVTRRSSPLQSSSIPPLSKQQQQQQEHRIESHHLRHHHHNDPALSSKGDRLRLNQATQTNDASHHGRRRTESEEERERRRRTVRRREEDERRQNKENKHLRSADDQPISRREDSFHGNWNNSSHLAANQSVLGHSSERSKGKSGREGLATGERHEKREVELEQLGARAKDRLYYDNRTKPNTKETKSKRSDERVHRTTPAALLSASNVSHPLRNDSQQPLPVQRQSSREMETKLADETRRRKMLWPSGEGRVVGRRTHDGKTLASEEDVSQRRLEREKRSRGQDPMTSQTNTVHGLSSVENLISGRENEAKGVEAQVAPIKGTSMHSHHGLLSKGFSSGRFSTAERVSLASVSKKDEATQTKSEEQTLNKTEKREGDLNHLHLQPTKNLPSEYQRQFQWKQQQRPATTEEQQQQQPTSAAQHQHPHRSTSVISLSHPDFRTLFASPSTDRAEDTEYRFQFRPISARTDRSNDRRSVTPLQNQMRRGQSLRDLSTGEENATKGRMSVIVRQDEKPRKYRSEYMQKFQPPWNYRYEDGTWREMEKRKRRNKSQVGVADDVVDAESSRSNSLLQSSSSASSWYEEVLQLRRHADEYRKRANGTHFSREHLEQLYARNVDSRGEPVAVDDVILPPSQNDSRSRRGRQAEKGTRRIEDGGRGERRTEDGGGERRTEDGRGERRTKDGRGSGGRPMRHHFDRTGQKHPDPQSSGGHQSLYSSGSSSDGDAYDDSELLSTAAAAESDRTSPHHRHHVSRSQSRFEESGESDEEERRLGRSPDRVIQRPRGEQLRGDSHGLTSFPTSTEVVRLRDRGQSKKTREETDSVSKEDKGVQINMEGGRTFQSNHQRILSSSSLASQVLERARNRKDKFWSK